MGLISSSSSSGFGSNLAFSAEGVILTSSSSSSSGAGDGAGTFCRMSWLLVLRGLAGVVLRGLAGLVGDITGTDIAEMKGLGLTGVEGSLLSTFGEILSKELPLESLLVGRLELELLLLPGV